MLLRRCHPLYVFIYRTILHLKFDANNCNHEACVTANYTASELHRQNRKAQQDCITVAMATADTVQMGDYHPKCTICKLHLQTTDTSHNVYMRLFFVLSSQDLKLFASHGESEYPEYFWGVNSCLAELTASGLCRTPCAFSVLSAI